ncbi:MAG: methyltransferase domain-containing protein [Chitinivibrionales bacterium]|nr:methyltransferase domain-containing protein [Chitinivibrionales bacterium]MBD3358345.1 methyltransferase domain-containing protein [Chitinivibrionales bacterium]
MIDYSETGPYARYETDGVVIYVHPTSPDWFVPTAAADTIIKAAFDDENALIDNSIRSRLLRRIAPPPLPAYTGREAIHELGALRECWLHITNRCNMQCAHCMFASSPMVGGEEADTALVLSTIDQAYALGTKIFYFTGGEPTIHPDFSLIHRHVLAKADTHCVILTNAATVRSLEACLRTAPPGRLHLQVSIDGRADNHDAIRGKGAYARLVQSLTLLRSWDIPVTLAMSVTKQNVTDMPAIVSVANQYGISGIHFMWLFKHGRAGARDFVDCRTLARQLIAADERARALSVTIDNIEVIRSQVFSVPGTRFDLSNSGWESLALGPDGWLYPSPALVGCKLMRAGHVGEGVEKVWRRGSVFDKVRKASLVQAPNVARHPLRFLIGGGDIDHSYYAARNIVGADPYIPLYSRIALYLIANYARSHVVRAEVGLRCRMGEFLCNCGPDGAPRMFTHSNCVQSLSTHDSRDSVRSFYSDAAESVNEEILNPVSYGEHAVAHIPRRMRVRSYGCGSPVLDCGVKEGQRLVDLGSGAGIECFIASKMVGANGQVYGVDMADAMLERARRSLPDVSANLGYRNVEFRKGYLEALPLDDEGVDTVISNCVINLTPDKRRVFQEIYRVLKPGGTLCISDIVTDSHPPIDMKYDERLRGECLAGAMLQDELFAVLEDLGFVNLYLIRRYEYRRIRSHPFYSVTYRAARPGPQKKHTVIYRGPLRSVRTEDGEEVSRGAAATIAVDPARLPDQMFFVLDDSGSVVNVEQQTACGVFVSPTKADSDAPAHRFMSDCMVCGAPLTYFSTNQQRQCHYCNQRIAANACCTDGHFVCDECHCGDARAIIKRLCAESRTVDPLALFNHIRSHPAFPSQGPEYHMLVPAVLVAAYRNAYGTPATKAITTAVERGATVAGGACAFLGACGGALGVGTAFSIILDGTPFEGRVRQKVQLVTAEILKYIARFEAARCCRRDCAVAVTQAAELSGRYLPHPLHVSDRHINICTHGRENEHCLGSSCPWWAKPSASPLHDSNTNEDTLPVP